MTTIGYAFSPVRNKAVYDRMMTCQKNIDCIVHLSTVWLDGNWKTPANGQQVQFFLHRAILLHTQFCVWWHFVRLLFNCLRRCGRHYFWISLHVCVKMILPIHKDNLLFWLFLLLSNLDPLSFLNFFLVILCCLPFVKVFINFVLLEDLFPLYF